MTSVFNSKITEVENKIPDIKNLASKTELTAVENKTPNISGLATKINYNTKISEIENKINNSVTTTGLVKKIDFDDELKKVNDKISTNSSEILLYESRLKQKEDVINSLERHASYNRGKTFFGHHGQQNYLVFQLMYEYLKRVIVTTNNISTIYVHYWQSKGLSNEQIKPPNISANNVLAPW